MNEILVLSTAGTAEQAGNIAAALVENREAACVNVIPGIRSIYRWEGKVWDEGECLLIIKSRSDKFEAIRERIKSLHSYAVPEIIALPIVMGDEMLMIWLCAIALSA